MSRFHGRAAAVVVLLGCSCRALLGIDDPAVGIDAPVADASLADAAPAQVCLGSAAWLQVCLTPPAVDRAFPKQMVVTGVGPSGPGSGSGLGRDRLRLHAGDRDRCDVRDLPACT